MQTLDEATTQSAKALTAEAAATYCGVSLRTFQRLVVLHKIPRVKYSTRCIRYDIRDLDKFMSERRK